MTDYGYSVEVAEGYDEAVVRARLALKGEGFSIVTEMHVGGLLGAEAGEGRQYLIMGVWNPVVSQRELDENLRVAVHLPCNVVVQEMGRRAVVAALDPTEMFEEGAVPQQLADEAREALGRAFEKVTQGS